MRPLIIAIGFAVLMLLLIPMPKPMSTALDKKKTLE
jgi:uncharacterized protein YoxC